MKRPFSVQKVLKKGSFGGSGDPKMTPFWTPFWAIFGPLFEQVLSQNESEYKGFWPILGQKGVSKWTQKWAIFGSSPKGVQNRGPGSGPKKHRFLAHFWTVFWPFLQAYMAEKRVQKWVKKWGHFLTPFSLFCLQTWYQEGRFPTTVFSTHFGQNGPKWPKMGQKRSFSTQKRSKNARTPIAPLEKVVFRTPFWTPFWAISGPLLDHLLSPNPLDLSPIWALFGSEMAQKWTQKWAKNGPKMGHFRGPKWGSQGPRP